MATSSSPKSSAATIYAPASPDAGFKTCCMKSGAYDGANRNYYFQGVVALIARWLATGIPGGCESAVESRCTTSFEVKLAAPLEPSSRRKRLRRLSLEVLAKRASKDERPRCSSRAVALRDDRFRVSLRVTVMVRNLSQRFFHPPRFPGAPPVDRGAGPNSGPESRELLGWMILLVLPNGLAGNVRLVR